ncbi:hypothetical protein, partial [Solemya velum gill symbiont]|uniref:hypothetical protein n=1 Tax=Solemya velum gill symbiont TaxID=2340 RepID=UPI001C4E2DF6
MATTLRKDSATSLAGHASVFVVTGECINLKDKTSRPRFGATLVYWFNHAAHRDQHIQTNSLFATVKVNIFC